MDKFLLDNSQVETFFHRQCFKISFQLFFSFSVNRNSIISSINLDFINTDTNINFYRLSTLLIDNGVSKAIKDSINNTFFIK